MYFREPVDHNHSSLYNSDSSLFLKLRVGDLPYIEKLSFIWCPYHNTLVLVVSLWRHHHVICEVSAFLSRGYNCKKNQIQRWIIKNILPHRVGAGGGGVGLGPGGCCLYYWHDTLRHDIEVLRSRPWGLRVGRPPCSPVSKLQAVV
jgi:hypothetical protein